MTGDINTDLVAVDGKQQSLCPMKPPTADAGPNQTVVEGATVQLDGSASDDSDGTIASFQWVLGGETVATGENAKLLKIYRWGRIRSNLP